jgi:predicted transcriptional regulator
MGAKPAIMFYMGMTDEIRQKVRDAMREQGLSTYKLADKVGTSQPNIARILTGRSGSIPALWEKTLDALGLELVAKKKGAK